MKRLQLISIVLLVLVLASLPQVIKKDSTINLLILIFLYITLATGWNILGGYAGQTSLGHAAYFGLGALATRMLWFKGFPILPSLVAGGILAVIFALLIGGPAFRLKGVYFAIGTLALAQILYVTVGNIYPEISALPVNELVSYEISDRYYLFLGIAVFAVAAAYFLVNSKLGLGMMAVREEEDAAESLGVSAMEHKLIALGVSAFITALGGGAFAYYHVSFYPQFPFSPGLEPGHVDHGLHRWGRHDPGSDHWGRIFCSVEGVFGPECRGISSDCIWCAVYSRGPLPARRNHFNLEKDTACTKEPVKDSYTKAFSHRELTPLHWLQVKERRKDY